jgi:large subunit ribosomal protein L7Ae
MVGTELSKELLEEAYRAIEAAKATGKITKGCNETTKALERGVVKLVAVAKDVSPPEVVLHLPGLAKEKGVACVEVPTREELGAAAGLGVKTACVGIVKEGDAKKVLASLLSQLGVSAKAEAKANEKAKEESKEPAEEEEVTDESKEESKEPAEEEEVTEDAKEEAQIEDSLSSSNDEEE